ncbi:hypothetical protein K2173_014003 [Erythroxylum novogranatense]|uniref:Uncharacterized protein n=1 Tax=Erythroxylum novogranatense TaxID=1862640 RepID=A0AAV8SD27_9ROSI|nr:hypothetical protein K2173_014003 [Erythroxylum novogranatense]
MDPLAVLEEGDEWELRHDDDGFTYKIRKRRRLLSDPQPSHSLPAAADPRADEKRRRERKRKTLLKLKCRYEKEIESWDLLSNNLRSMQERANEQLQVHKQASCLDQTRSFQDLDSEAESRNEDACGSLVDGLLLQAEAQEAIICDVSNLCDVAEAICNAEQEQLVQSFINLPIWSSPRELLTSLCDE